MRSDTNPNHVKRILVTHLTDDGEHKHTIEFQWPVALCYELDIACAGNGDHSHGYGARLLIYLADKSRPVLKAISGEVSPLSLKMADQDMHITIQRAFVHCPGLPSSISLDQMDALETEYTQMK